MPSPRRTRTLAAVAAAGGTLLVVAGPAAIAAAHIRPEPGEVTTGAPTVVGFTIEHGCEGSPTNQVELKIPEGFVDVTAQPVDGWTVAVADGVASWTGGSLGPDTEGTFSLELTATRPGRFEIPMVQTCDVGELAWIQTEIEGQPEPDYPAPVLAVVGDPIAAPADTELPADTTVADTTAAVTETTAGSDTTVAEESDDHGDSHDDATSDTTAPLVIAPAPDADSSGDGEGTSNTGAVVGGMVAAIVLLGGGGYALMKKRGSGPAV